MYQAYTGFGKNKILCFKDEDLEQAKHRCAIMAAVGLHCGLMLNGKVIFNTNREDAEYFEHLSQYDEQNQ